MPSPLLRTSQRVVAVLAVALAVAACHPSTAATSTPTPTAAPGDLPIGNSSAAMPGPGTCKLGTRDGQPLPDPNCTPGAVNPAVRQDTIKDTICKSGWTKTVRPPTSKTNAMKAASARSYDLAPGDKSEYDHLLSGVVTRKSVVCAGQSVGGMPVTMGDV